MNYCTWCNGYGSSLKDPEGVDRCTRCGGSGIERTPAATDNEKDLAEIPKNIKDKLNIVPVKWIDEVFELALQQTPRPLRGGVVVTPQRDTSVDDGESTEATLPH